MIYEILVRGKDNQITADHLIHIASDMTTRCFEKWLRERAFLGSSVLRWRIVQTSFPAHFYLATQEHALENRIAELSGGRSCKSVVPKIVRQPKSGSAESAKAGWGFGIAAAY